MNNRNDIDNAKALIKQVKKDAIKASTPKTKKIKKVKVVKVKPVKKAKALKVKPVKKAKAFKKPKNIEN